MKRPFFAVLGGMGTLATESYIRVLNARTEAAKDQDYLDYLVFNDASVPDRTAFITQKSEEDPFPVIADDIQKATAVGASFLVLTCNTAHYFYDRFQALTDVPVLHMPKLAVEKLAEKYPAERFHRVGLLATVGTRTAGAYQKAIEDAGYTYVEPSDELQAAITRLIYDDVKDAGRLDEQAYRAVLDAFLNPSGAYRCDALILGCTELSVLNEAFPLPELPVIDAQSELVDESIRLAQKLRA
ncbi:aspartate racemase [Alloscardovia macacae]|uniref:Aspartate racemase n=1 Tax=Alloscardovia macacae TaxID=1160091 RepID=A0A1Y2SY57_9BIFI|nr:amino acid racemase [Alloscardovia macacae]OTA26784.1 aspartate racemase [Alloscardovia macacae]OTA29206.1 aspartate racemase [Alloscardovia macacae]